MWRQGQILTNLNTVDFIKQKNASDSVSDKLKNTLIFNCRPGNCATIMPWCIPICVAVMQVKIRSNFHRFKQYWFYEATNLFRTAFRTNWKTPESLTAAQVSVSHSCPDTCKFVMRLCKWGKGQFSRNFNSFGFIQYDEKQHVLRQNWQSGKWQLKNGQVMFGLKIGTDSPSTHPGGANNQLNSSSICIACFS